MADSEDGPSSVEAFGEAYQKARRMRIAVVGAVLVLLAGAVVGVSVYQRQKAKRNAQLAYAELTQCLFGGAPPSGDQAAVRFRAGQLSAMGVEEILRAPVNKVSWPKRCGYRAQELLEAAKSAGYTSREQKDLPYWADQLAAALKSPQGHSMDVSEPLLRMLEEAEKHGLQAQEGSEPGPPSGSAAPLTIDSLKPFAPITKKAFTLRSIQLDVYPGPRRRFLVTELSLPESPLLCHFDDQTLACASLPEPLPSLGHTLSLLGTETRSPFALIAAGQYGESGVYRSDTGQKLYEGYSYGAHVFEDGTVAALIENKKGKHPFLVWIPAGKEAQQSKFETKLLVGSFAYNSALLWGRLVLRGFEPQEEKPAVSDDEAEEETNRAVRLETLTLDPAKQLVGEPKLAGQLGTFFGGGLGAGNDDPDLWGCHDGSRFALLVDQGRDSFSVVQAQDSWATPLRTPRFVRSKVLCDSQSVSWNSLRFGREEEPWEVSLRHQRCTTAECKTLTGSLKDLLVGGLELAPRAKMVDALSFGEQVILAWVAGERGGVRFRIGPADKLAQAPEVVVFDDLAEGMKLREKSSISDLRLLGAPPGRDGQPSALLLLATEQGTFAIRVRSDGTFQPLGASPLGASGTKPD